MRYFYESSDRILVQIVNSVRSSSRLYLLSYLLKAHNQPSALRHSPGFACKAADITKRFFIDDVPRNKPRSNYADQIFNRRQNYLLRPFDFHRRVNKTLLCEFFGIDRNRSASGTSAGPFILVIKPGIEPDFFSVSNGCLNRLPPTFWKIRSLALIDTDPCVHKSAVDVLVNHLVNLPL